MSNLHHDSPRVHFNDEKFYGWTGSRRKCRHNSTEYSIKRYYITEDKSFRSLSSMLIYSDGKF